MNRSVWAVAAIALLGTAGVAGVVMVASSGGEEELLQQPASVTPTASASPASTVTSTANPVASPTAAATPSATAALSTPAPVPEGWLTHADSQGLYSFRYPSGWHVGTGGQRSVILTSWDTATWMSPQFPPDSIKVDVIVAPIEQAEAKPDGATSSSLLTGAQGWEIVYTYDPSTMGGVTRAHEIAADHGSYRYFVTGLFAQEHPDEATLLAIAASFKFGK